MAETLTYGDLLLVEDPVQRAAEIKKYLDRVSEALRLARELRDETALELLQTHPRSEVCALLGVGLSHIRSLQLVAGNKKWTAP
jgi:hypothetical protein